MEQSQGWNVQRGELLSAVRGARLRWRLRRALLGGALAIVGSLVVLTSLAYALAGLAYGDGAVIASQVVAGAIVVALFWFLLVRPLLPRPSDAQMAHFIEEHDPTLDAALLTAVELDAREKATGALGRSPALASRLFQNARERIRKIDDARAVDRGALQGSAAAFAVAATLAFLTALMGPPILKHGIKLLLTPWDRAQPASLYAIMVEPGNATVARGGDQLVSAKLYNFQSDSVDLLVRRSDSTGWTRVAMTRDSSGAAYSFRLLDIVGAMDYLVESNGIRSRPYRLDIADLPYTKSMRLELRYPAYTQLAPRVIDGGGDIAALQGTTVRVQVTPTRAAASGLLVKDNGDTISLRAGPDGVLSGTMRVDKPGFYKVQLRTTDGRLVPASLEYTIDVLPDRPPTIEFTKPGRDTKVLAVDEVYSEVHAQDDYGVAKVDLVFSVNGGPERSVPLQQSTARALTDVSAGHTFMLEDYQLQPGDVVSYYARVVDNNAASGAQSAATDIYFLQVRPYDQDYRQQQGGGGGGGGGEQQNSLSQQQREIIAGTFKTSRDKAKTAPKELEENLATLRLSQQRLREQVEELARKLVQRGVAGQDSNFKRISDILPKAAAVMDTAEKSLAGGDPQQALAPEQRALQQLQRAEAIYKEVQIQQGGGGGGGGGGQGQRAEDLADLFEMNRDKLRNQYESVQRGQQEQQQRNQQVDETLERLKRLAARQQQENERAQRKADSMSLGQSGSGGGGGQRQMAQEAEQTARQLERLAREQQSRELADAARRLQEAADAMRRAAASGQQGGAEGRAAAEQLDRARRLLEQEKSGRTNRDVDNLREQARQIAEQEKRIASEVEKLGEENGRAQRAQSIAQQKADQANAMRNLKSQLERMSLDNRREQKEASQQLAEAAQALRDRKTEEKIRASQAQVQFASPEYAKAMEESIRGDIADLGQRLDNASKSAAKGQQDGQRESQALDRTRDLVNGMESLADRMRQRQEASGRRLGQGQQGQGEQGQGEQSRNQSGQGQQQNGQQGQQGQGQGQGQNQSQAQGGGQRQGQNQQNQQNQGQQGQGGGNGQQNGQQGGRNGQGGQPQNGRQAGGMNNGAPSSANGGRLSEGDARQFSRELRERLSDAQQLRDDLRRQGMDVAELDRAIQGMRSLANESLLMDANAAAMLKTQIVDGLKGFEFGLRRSLGAADGDRVLLGRSGDVPEAYRQYVEEYYRSLAGGKKKP